MQYNEIGKTGMRVSNLSFGASSLGGVFHGIREDEAIEAVHTAVNGGINFIDVSFQTKFFVQKELDIRGSRNALPSDFRAVIHYLERGTCPVDEFISMECSPERATEAMEKWAEAAGKVFRILVKF